jgi:hypothetical protein
MAGLHIQSVRFLGLSYVPMLFVKNLIRVEIVRIFYLNKCRKICRGGVA